MSSTAKQIMAKNIRFHYFHGRGLGEPVRLLLTTGNVSFVDHRYSLDEFAAMDTLKASLPFGQIPALEVDGVYLGQTDSVLRLAGKLAGLYPDDPVEAARVDMIIVHQADIHGAIAKMSFDGVPGAPGTRMVPEAERQERIEAWFSSALPTLLERLERQAHAGFMVGTTTTSADICVFNRLTQLLDINEQLLNGQFPQLRAVYERIAAMPAIHAWIENHAGDYPRGNSPVPG